LDQVSATYNYWLVALSFAVAILTSYTTVDLAARVTANRGSARGGWLTGGALVMGSGIWCMHYIGMLAYRLPMPVYYHIPTVGLSLLAAILASFTALYVVSRERMTRVNTGIGALVMGTGIAAMHYIGMAAMRLNAMHRYDHALCAVSIVLAVVISFVGLTLIFYLRDESRGLSFKLSISVILGLAIPVMHYTGMAAVSFREMNGKPDLTHSVNISEVAGFGIFAVTGVILGFTLMTSMIDRRISVQQLLLDNERKMLRALIDHIPEGMYVKDTAGRFVVVNVHLAQSVGKNDPRLLIGKTDYDFFPLELAKKFDADEKRVMQSGQALFDLEETGFDVAGHRVPLLTTKVPLRDGRGQVTGIAGVGRDISDRKKNEEALREAEQKYRSMFDEAFAGLFELAPDGHVLHVNPPMAELLGYASPEEIAATMTDSLWTRAVLPERSAELAARMEAAGYVRSFEMEVFRNDGSRVWISTSARAKWQNGTLIGYAGMFEDITERKLLREQLLQAQKLESVGQLAAGIAHEINTPVQYIGDNVRFLQDSFGELVTLNVGYARLLAAVRSTEVTPQLFEEVSLVVEKVDVDYLFEEIPKAIEQTLEGVSRVAALVGAMKEFSHPGTGEKVPLDLNRAIESTITVARNEWKYVADMEVELDPALPLVSCLPGEFNQVILNMIVNAAHAIEAVAASGGPEKGQITIRTRSLPTGVEVQIQDTGGGIPEKIRSRIFDPFFTTKEIGKGTGQGLAIARSVVVDKHQGTIDFETEDGRGTTFIIRLPCEAVPSPSPDLAIA
jgi:PAS domain S-box-containing protein